ncbi:hypothetical protein BBJ28_00024083 [Nothophytophthora sp. Chile5]|nr:hypothetical protein BBJ28_00024083 [Nothophytophthora sp. Chile5]
MMHMLQICKRILPLGRDQWDPVASQYNQTKNANWGERETDSLRRKFKQLATMPKPTGRADMASHIHFAKEIRVEIDAKADIILPVPDVDGTGDDAYPDSCDDGSEVVNESAPDGLSQSAAGGYVSSGTLPPSQCRVDGTDQLMAANAEQDEAVSQTTTTQTPSWALGCPENLVGLIQTLTGLLGVEFASDIAESSKEPEDNIADVETEATTSTGSYNAAVERESGGDTRCTVTTNSLTPKKVRGKGKRKASWDLDGPLPTRITPGGAKLRKNPGHGAHDKAEARRHPSLLSDSNRLGGDDLGVMRDSF